MSCCLGSAAVGARTFTATAGQGLELMHEVLYVASSMRLPIIMAVANRALSGPLNVWGDHSDVMATRDVGWIQIFVENGQEAVDNIICAFRIGEDRRVRLPVMVNMDGFCDETCSGKGRENNQSPVEQNDHEQETEDSTDKKEGPIDSTCS